MPATEGGRIAVRSYRGVVDEVERRIFRVDRWRLPTPHGVPVRAVGYAFAALLALIVASGLPLIGAVLALVPDSLRLAGLPALAGWALASLRIDGRPPHRALAGMVRYLAKPRSWAGLRSCPAAGAPLTPIHAVETAALPDDTRLRPGRVRGPARLAVRYPVQVEVAGAAGHGPTGPASRIAGARQVKISASGRPRRPLQRAQTIRIPAGREVRIR